jgi:hypothetical protein
MSRIGSHAGGGGLAIAIFCVRVEPRPARIGNTRNASASRGLYYDMRGGRSCRIKDEAMAELIIKMIAGKPKAATHWSVRAIVHLLFLHLTVAFRGAISAPV